VIVVKSMTDGHRSAGYVVYVKKNILKILYDAMKKELSDLKGFDYQIIYADPPWKYYGDPNKDQAAGKHYDCMTVDEICDLPVKDIIHSKAVCLMWATSTKMPESLRVMESWGFHFRGVHQVWVKTTKDGKIIHGQGVRPSFVKPTVEYLLIGATTKKGRTLPILTESMPNVVLAGRPGNKHSKKPDKFRDSIVDLFGDVKRIELFARNTAQGWDSWGNEV
jgi:N6-adenosine-specific RNA methylase IME4